MKILGIYVKGDEAIITIAKGKKIISHLELDIPSLKKFLKKKNFYIASAIDTKDVLIKNVIIEASKKDIIKAVEFQKNVITSLESKDSIIETIIGKENNKKREIFFYVTKKKLLKEHLKKYENVFKPDFTSCVPHSQIRFAKHFFPDKNQMILLHIDKTETSIVVMENGLSKEAHNLNIGFKDLKNDQEDFFNKVAKIFYSFLHKEKNKKLPVFFSGKGMHEENFYDNFYKKNKLFISEILYIKKPHLLPYAISMGICLDLILKDKKNLQFLKEEFVSKKILKKNSFFNFCLLGFSLISTFFFFFFGKKVLNEKKMSLEKNISFLEKIENISKKNDLDSLNLGLLKKHIDKESKYFPYFPIYPKVSFILSYLSSHKMLQKAKIYKLNYKLLEYPIKKNEKTYKTKIFLEFSSDAINARKFFESLKKEEFVVSKDISWDLEEDRYKVSFFLKNLKLKDFYE